MHRSRLGQVVIDCKTEDLDAAATFWSRALGRAVVPPKPDSDPYRELATDDEELLILVQRVNHPSRAHLDIESDDVEAEVKRLEALGARRVEFVKTWWVMEAPTGQRFCVIRQQRGPLTSRATQWPDGGDG